MELHTILTQKKLLKYQNQRLSSCNDACLKTYVTQVNILISNGEFLQKFANLLYSSEFELTLFLPEMDNNKFSLELLKLILLKNNLIKNGIILLVSK